MRIAWMVGGVVVGLISGCGGSGSGGGSSGSGGSGASAGSGGVAGGGVGGGSGSGGASGGASGAGGASGGSGGSGGARGCGGGGAAGAGGASGIATPMPPAGTTKCGEGTFTAQEALTACQTPPNVGSLHPSYPAQCSMADTNGGQWEAWCTSSGLSYVWVLFKEVALSQSCSYFAPNFTFSSQELGYGATSESGEPYEAQPFTSVAFSTVAQDAGFHFQISGGASGAKSGGGQIWIAGDGSCGSPVPNDVKATFLAFAFSWSG